MTRSVDFPVYDITAVDNCSRANRALAPDLVEAMKPYVSTADSKSLNAHAQADRMREVPGSA